MNYALHVLPLIQQALREDITDPSGSMVAGDHSSLASIPAKQTATAKLLVKANGTLAGVEVATMVLREVDAGITFSINRMDGESVQQGDIAFIAEGNARSLLRAERVLLNYMQRMSGIATLTGQYVQAVQGTGATILDTRKTTPNNRLFEKWAVKIGGGENHRFGLFDMVMLKDNHVDVCGGVEAALDATEKYLRENGWLLRVEIETRHLDEVARVVKHGKAQRIMFDNFSVADVRTAVQIVGGQMETEVSGGVNLQTVRAYAETGVRYISVGALTHSAPSFDLSFKVVLS